MMMLKKHLLLFTLLKMGVLLNIFVEAATFFQDSLNILDYEFLLSLFIAN